MKSISANHENSGLAFWMLEVPRESDKARAGFDDKAVHDLRVALRRCRSLADGFRAVDPDKNWKKMRRQATELFDSLGALRDCHVMRDWIQRLGREEDPVAQRLSEYVAQLESGFAQQARIAIEGFDRRKWQGWTNILPRRTARLQPGSEVFQALALEKLDVARRLQGYALKTAGEIPLHRLRIALKKFRYVIENFLPQEHSIWKTGLKDVQELLGEVHDLDLLKHALEQTCGDLDPQCRGQWEERIAAERADRIARYKQLVSGEDSLWARWRSGLPRGVEARQASLKRLQVWSTFLETDTRHSRRVARFAVQIRDGLARVGVLDGDVRKDRELLRAAATAHEVGRAAGDKNHHKRSGKMISRIEQLPGWTREEVLTMAQVARYHRGTLPQTAELRDLAPAQRQRIRLLAGILRLANALDDEHDGSVRGVSVRRRESHVVIYAEGLRNDSVLAETVAGARHLLEVCCGLPIIVQPAPRRRVVQPPRKRPVRVVSETT